MAYPSRLLAAHRRRTGTPRGSRALGPFRQAVLVLRRFRERGCVHCLARDAGIFQATGYRYLHEGIDLLAEKAPDLHEVLHHCRHAGMTHVILDGTFVETDRLAGVRDNGNDLCFSRKHSRRHRAVLRGPGRRSAVGLRCRARFHPRHHRARIHALPALYKAGGRRAAHPCDKGYIGAGIGILVPVRRRKESRSMPCTWTHELRTA
ncbi:hypothetical protein SAMN05421773_11548 [Streptomyces aidingensis]|uniref:DDE superfamily endonuclease n=1 Tax=Streptomyces aidingensis TaxID=910347 RepID=A0A1I1SAY3_9ACTN|nr:hypothetical protein SAMN05421773_11548 [Streptomyces aidingensis]